MPSATETTIAIVTTYDAYQTLASSSDLTVQSAAATAGGVYTAAVGPFLNINNMTGAGNLAGINLVVSFVVIAKINADADAGKDIALGDVVSLIGTGVTAVAAVAAVATGVVASPALITGLGLISAIGALYANQQGHSIKDFFDAAQKFRFRSDPLTLDLDGDGLETVGIDPNAPILFDHNADGIKTGTGWVSADDGMLVLDRNGNGSIDTGQELFGDSTLKSNGQLATDGFDALADLDSNADGQISSADAQFASLRVWRDLNQDGISQGGELFTLDSLGIASISTAQTANSQTLANENQIADLGTYTRTDGSTGTSRDLSGRVAAQQRGTHRPTPCGCNLAADTFHREFTSTLDTTAVAALPDMQGSGVLRDLRQAATQSATLLTECANDAAFEMKAVGCVL